MKSKLVKLGGWQLTIIVAIVALLALLGPKVTGGQVAQAEQVRDVPAELNSSSGQWATEIKTGDNSLLDTTALVTSTEGLAAVDAEKMIDDAFNTANRAHALWNIQPGLGTVMIEYGNRLARMWYAGNADNWDMAKYQFDEALEIQEVGETTRPARAPKLKAFEKEYLEALGAAIMAKDKAKFTDAFNKTIQGCNECHTASTGPTWNSYKYVEVQMPKTDPAFYIDWKGGGQDNYIANPPAAATAAPKEPMTGVLDAAGTQKLLFDKMNAVDRSLALWNIQPGLGTVMIEYGNRWERLWYAAEAGNWDMAKYQLDEALEIQEVGETTRPARAPKLKAFEKEYLEAVDKAILAQDKTAFKDAYAKAIDGCNECHTTSKAANWSSYQFVKIQMPTADNADYLVWNAPHGTGSYIANPPPAATVVPKPEPSGPIDEMGVTQMISDTFGTVDRSLALWNIQPGLGTVMIEYGRRLAQMSSAINAGNWDMAKYQLDEAIEIQEVGETTRPTRVPKLKAFEKEYLEALDAAILAQDKSKAEAALKSTVEGCNECHTTSKAANWSSYGYVVIQLPKTDPADYLKWDTPGGTGNYKP